MPFEQHLGMGPICGCVQKNNKTLGGQSSVPSPTHTKPLASWHPLAHILAFLSNIKGLYSGMVLPYHSAIGILLRP
jgi:hypothetical protein